MVSQAGLETLRREWQENDLDGLPTLIAGQEHGTKAEHIKHATQGKYDSDKILMLGDAPGDLSAAQANHALFFPIIPGSEEQSWKALLQEGLPRFFEGSFVGAYQEKLLNDFDRALPSTPPWKS